MEESNNSPKKRANRAKAKLDKLGPKGSGLASFGAFIHRKTGQKAGLQGTKKGKKGFDKKAERRKVSVDERDYALERKNYHGKPEQMERNRARKRARYALEKAGKVKRHDKMDVHHKDNNPLNNDEKNLAVQTQAINRSEPRHRDDSVAAEGINDAATVLGYRKRKGIKESVLKASGVLGWMKRKGELDATEIEEAGRQFPKGKAKADHLSNLKKKVSQTEKKKGKASAKITDRTPKGFGIEEAISDELKKGITKAFQKSQGNRKQFEKIVQKTMGLTPGGLKVFLKASGFGETLIFKEEIDVDEAFEEIEEDRKPLTVVQRLRRRQVMRRSKFKLQRARKIKSKKLATGDQLQKRSRKAAIATVRKRVAGKKGENFKNLAPGDKASVERRVASKGALVNKLARRLMPQIRKKEQARLKQVRSRKTNEGAETNIAQGKATDSREKMAKRHADEKARNRDKSLSDIDRAKAKDKRNLRLTAKEAIIAKSEKSGIPVMTLVEVFKRGQAAYTLNDKQTRQQHAFARVNSFIAGGKAREMDIELDEVWWDKVIAKLDQISHPKDYGKMVTAYAELMRQEKYKKRPNMAADQVAREYRGVSVREFIKYINTLVAKKVLPQELKAEYEVDEMDSDLCEVGGAGEWGTDELRQRYAADTPGQTQDIQVASYAPGKPEIAEPYVYQNNADMIALIKDVAQQAINREKK
tara:strand:- start:602 stop:2704 length:2103 start_codon:yes stop_codon:yes gene_type:complete